MITYAGVSLTAPDSRSLKHFADWWAHHGIRESSTAPRAAINWGTTPRPPHADAEHGCPRLDVLHWPTGAARWATFHHLVSGEQLDEILDAASWKNASGDRTGDRPSELVIDDGEHQQVALMAMLPPRPICKTGEDELYLLSLVDERYFWWYSNQFLVESGSGLPFVGGYATWGDLLAALGLTDLYDDIPTEYGTPSRQWTGIRLRVPQLLDAIATALGARWRFRLNADGERTMRMVRWSTAKTDLDSQWDEYQERVVTGGRMDTLHGLSGNVRVTYTQGAFGGDTRSYFTSGADGFGKYLGTWPTTADQPRWKTWPRIPMIESERPAVLPETDQSAASTQIARDYFEWQLADLEATFSGVVHWGSTGAEDAVEWLVDYESNTVRTTVLRPIAQDPGPIFGELRVQEMEATRVNGSTVPYNPIPSGISTTVLATVNSENVLQINDRYYRAIWWQAKLAGTVELPALSPPDAPLVFGQAWVELSVTMIQPPDANPIHFHRTHPVTIAKQGSGSTWLVTGDASGWFYSRLQEDFFGLHDDGLPASLRMSASLHVSSGLATGAKGWLIMCPEMLAQTAAFPRLNSTTCGQATYNNSPPPAPPPEPPAVPPLPPPPPPPPTSYPAGYFAIVACGSSTNAIGYYPGSPPLSSPPPWESANGYGPFLTSGEAYTFMTEFLAQCITPTPPPENPEPLPPPIPAPPPPPPCPGDAPSPLWAGGTANSTACIPPDKEDDPDPVVPPPVVPPNPVIPEEVEAPPPPPPP